MIWRDTIANIIDCVNAQCLYDSNVSTTPSNLALQVFNQAQDYLNMLKPWTALVATTQLTLDSDNKITLPSDYGRVLSVYTDSSGIGKPVVFFYLECNEVSQRYTEETTFDSDNVRTVKFAFPTTVGLDSNPYVQYSKTLDVATQDDYDTGTKRSFFPKNIMLATVRLLMLDYTGIAGHQSPDYVRARFNDELKSFEAYAYQNNVPLTLAIHDKFGNNVYIPGASLDGSKSSINIPYPYNDATLISGGAW